MRELYIPEVTAADLGAWTLPALDAELARVAGGAHAVRGASAHMIWQQNRQAMRDGARDVLTATARWQQDLRRYHNLLDHLDTPSHVQGALRALDGLRADGERIHDAYRRLVDMISGADGFG